MQSLLRTPQERLNGDAEGPPPLMPPDESFDPITVLRALDGRRVAYIVIGGLGRVIQGSPGLTDGTDIVPSMREENVHKLALALEDLNARRTDGKRLRLDADLAREELVELASDAGELKIVPEPAGTRGYDDLRRAATREPLGSRPATLDRLARRPRPHARRPRPR